MRGSPRHGELQTLRLAVFAAAGFCIGGALGYMFIGTAHAVLITRDAAHYQDEGASLVGRLPGQSLMEAETAHQVIVNHTIPQQDTGSAVHPDQGAPKWPATGTTIHTLCTSNGSPYLNFQTRIMYGTYKLVQKMNGGDQLVAFTRILHRTRPDVLMNEVPSWQAQPLTPACDNWCEFPVSDRPNAVAQWLTAARTEPSLIKAPWLLLIETDYVWMHPLQAPRAEDRSAASLAFHFDYIRPSAPNLEKVIRQMYPPEKGPTAGIPASGPAPVLLRVAELQKVAADWERLTAHIEADEESKRQLGWVREMYAFSIATALQGMRLDLAVPPDSPGVRLDLALPPDSPLIAQPPHDTRQGAAAMLHYTWGSIFTHPGNKSEVWKFDKRTYTEASIQINTLRTPRLLAFQKGWALVDSVTPVTQHTPRIPMPPAFQEGWVLEDNVTPVTQQLHDTVSAMLTQMNKAVDELPVATGMR